MSLAAGALQFVSRGTISRSYQRWATGFNREAGHIVSSRCSICVNLAIPLQDFTFTPLDKLGTHVIPETIFGRRSGKRDIIGTPAETSTVDPESAPVKKNTVDPESAQVRTPRTCHCGRFLRRSPLFSRNPHSLPQFFPPAPWIPTTSPRATCRHGRLLRFRSRAGGRWGVAQGRAQCPLL